MYAVAPDTAPHESVTEPLSQAPGVAVRLVGAEGWVGETELRVAMQLAVVPPPDPRHCHDDDPPCTGNAGLDGDAVPALQSAPLYAVAPEA